MSGVDGVGGGGSRPDGTQGVGDVGATNRYGRGRDADDLVISHYHGGDQVEVAGDHDMPPPYLGSSAAIMLMLINVTGQANQKLSSTVSNVLKDQNHDQMAENQKRMDAQANYDKLVKHDKHDKFWEDFGKIVGASLMMAGGLAFGVITYGAGSEVTVATTMLGTSLIGSVAIADAAGGFNHLKGDTRMAVTMSLYAIGAAMTLGANLPAILQSLKNFATAGTEVAAETGMEAGAGAASSTEDLLAEAGSTAGIPDSEAFAEDMTNTIAAAQTAEDPQQAAEIFVTGLRQALIDGGVDTGELTEEMQQQLTSALEAALEDTGVAGEPEAAIATEEAAETNALGEGVVEPEANVQQPQLAEEAEGDETFAMDYQEEEPPLPGNDELPDAEGNVAISQQKADQMQQNYEELSKNGKTEFEKDLADHWKDQVKNLPQEDDVEGSVLQSQLKTGASALRRGGKIAEGVQAGIDGKNQSDVLRNQIEVEGTKADLEQIKGESDRIQTVIKDAKPLVAAYATKVKSTINATAEILSNLDDGNQAAAERIGAPPMGAMS